MFYNVPESVNEATAPWNRRDMVGEAQCRNCDLFTRERDLYLREDFDGSYFLCGACVPKCEHVAPNRWSGLPERCSAVAVDYEPVYPLCAGCARRVSDEILADLARDSEPNAVLIAEARRECERVYALKEAV